MKKMIENTIHPISQASGARIDLFFGCGQHHMTNDMMLLLEQSVPTLGKDENILLLNTLSVHEVMSNAADKISKGHLGRILVYSACGRLLREKLDFLAKMIVAKKITMIVLNSWEFAAVGSRQKHALASWLREMRDANKLRIVIYSMEEECPKFGALSLLAYTASSIDQVGEWKWHEKYQRNMFYPNATATVTAYIANREAQLAAEAASTEKATNGFTDQPGGMTMPRKQRHSMLNFVDLGAKLKGDLKGESLKNKELEVVGAREAVLELV